MNSAWIATTVKHCTAVMPETLRAAQAKSPFRDALSGVSDPYNARNEVRSGITPKVIELFGGVS
jgi:hypothetical protein